MTELRESLREIARTQMSFDPGHDLSHLDRVWQNAQTIAAGEGQGDLDVLLAASYLHDLVNLPKDSPDRTKASRMSAEAAAPLLTDLGFPDAKLSAVQHAIAAHSFSAGLPVETTEAAILRDADRLEAIGAIGIARAFRVSAGLDQAIYDPADPFAQDRPLDDGPFALDHWRVKLLGLSDGLLTQTARGMADERLDLMRGFLQQLAREIGRDVPDAWLT